MWSDRYDAEQGDQPLSADPYTSPGLPPWEARPRMGLAGRAAVAVVGLGMAALLVASTVRAWHVVDQVISNR